LAAFTSQQSPAAELQDESGDAVPALLAQSQQLHAVQHSTISSAAASAGPDMSAAASAVATGAAGFGTSDRAPTPPLPLIDFDLDLQPTPFDELFQERPLHPDEAALADDLASWLDNSLAEDAAAAAARQAAGQQHALQLARNPQGWTVGRQQQPASLHLAQAIMQGDVFDPLAGLLGGTAQQSVHSRQGVTHAYHQPLLSQQQPNYGVPTPQPASAAMLAPAVGVPSQLAQAGRMAAVGSAVQPAAQAAFQQPPAPRQPSPDTPAPTLATVSVKLFGCTPAELPPGLRDHLK
jgi:hypothetical protein